MEPTNDQPLKTKNNGPMEKVIKEEADNQNGESSQASTSGSTPPLGQSQQGSAHVPRNPVDTQEEADNQNGESSQASTSGSTPPLAQSQQGSAHVPRNPVDTQEEEPHTTHYFDWCGSDKKPTTFTCNKAGTVENVLKRSPLFNKFAKKEIKLVIVRYGKAISSHFPYSLIQNELLSVKYVKAVDKPKQPESKRKGPSGDLVTFHLLTKGGKKSTTQSVDDNTPKKKTKYFLERMQNRLVSQYQDLVKGMKVQQGSRLSSIQTLFHVEYGKNAQTWELVVEVKTMKELSKLSDSVCQVRIKGKAEGSGFLLFYKFVLTNGHVVKDIYNESTGQLSERVTVHFSFESLGQMESGAVVEEVVGFEYCNDESGHKHDWALLRLSADQTLPDVLLTRFGFLSQSGAICIIGHPSGGVKKTDSCLIIPTENRIQVVERHHTKNPEGVLPLKPHYRKNQESIQLITDRFFEDVSNDESNRQALFYESCFSFGSSGSPVFDEHCNVVAMHSGGYTYNNARGETESVIEYGYPLSIIIERIIVQLVKRERFDVLKNYLVCSCAHHQGMMTNVKKLVESRNCLAFKYAANNSVVTNDEILKTFFDFIFQREEPFPMDFN